MNTGLAWLGLAWLGLAERMKMRKRTGGATNEQFIKTYKMIISLPSLLSSRGFTHRLSMGSYIIRHWLKGSSRGAVEKTPTGP